MTILGSATIPAAHGYHMDRPTEEAAVAALSGSLGPRPAEDMWNLAVRALGLHRPVDHPCDLRRVAKYLIEAAQLTRVAGRSLKVNVITYQALEMETQ